MALSNPHDFLRVLADAFTPVRDTRGRLLGCVPRVTDDATATLSDAHGNVFELRIAAQVCVCVDLDAGQSPRFIDGFVALDDTDTDLAVPAVPAGADPDLAEGV